METIDKCGIEVEYRESTERVGALAYGLVAEVRSASGIPSEVFVFHRETRMLATGFPFDYAAGAVFQNVATPADIEETPSESECDDKSRFFRASKVSLVFRSQIDMRRAKEAIDEDMAALVESWRALNDENGYEVSETRVHGSVPEPDSNDSNDKEIENA